MQTIDNGAKIVCLLLLTEGMKKSNPPVKDMVLALLWSMRHAGKDKDRVLRDSKGKQHGQ